MQNNVLFSALGSLKCSFGGQEFSKCVFFHYIYEKKCCLEAFTWEICQISPRLTRRCLLSPSLQFLSAWVLVCSELQSRPRSFIQNQMRVWQPLHLRHFSARQLRLGKSPFFLHNVSLFCSTGRVKCLVQLVCECGAVGTRGACCFSSGFAVALPACTSLSPCRCRWTENRSLGVFG